jgi:hypothetical protein
MPLKLVPRQTPDASVTPISAQGWKLSIPSGPARVYRWAQVDDYLHRSRLNFPWTAPLTMSLDARISHAGHQGTWGFGLWNDPFNASFGLGGMAQRLPALPNAAWFFYASPPNYLSFEDQLPAQGLLAATFRSPLVPAIALAPAVIALPTLLWARAARFTRRLASRVIQQSAARIEIDATSWRHYQLTWSVDQVSFTVTNRTDQSQLFTFRTSIAPKGRCGLVIWIDNQYAAFDPKGRLAYGNLINEQPAWLEIDRLTVTI